MPWGISEIWAVGAVLVVLVAIVFYGIYRLGVFSSDERDGPPEGTDRVDRSDERDGEYRIPLRDKPKQLPPMLKMSLVAVGLAFCVLGYYAFLFLRSGNPVEIRYASQMQATAVIAGALIGGVKLRQVRERRLGILYREFEEQDNTELDRTDKIYFDKARAERDDEGNLVIYELFSNDILGLFRRRKQAGHDRKLRSIRPLGDFVSHQVPKHAIELDDGVYLMRTQGKKLNKSPTTVADYTYRPPVKLPYRVYRNQKREMYQMRMEMNMLKSQLASAEDELDELAQVVKNREYLNREDFLDLLDEFMDSVNPGVQHYHVQRERGIRRHPEDGQEAPGKRLQAASEDQEGSQ